MAFFKFRQGGDNPSASTRQAESIEVMRQRARHRLIGAAVLILVGVVGFPVLFDTQPRSIPVDVQIEMPDKNKVAPLQIPQAPAAPTQTSQASVPNSTKIAAAASLDAKEQLMVPDAGKNQSKAPAARAVGAIGSEANPELKAEPKPAPLPKPEPKAESKPEPKSEPKLDGAAEAKADDGARAKSLLEGKENAKESPKAQGEDSRYIIQVGAFADPVKARETRLKLESAGLKTYTHIAETKDGPRTRVRVGPFSSKAEAEKVAAKVRALSLPSAILTL